MRLPVPAAARRAAYRTARALTTPLLLAGAVAALAAPAAPRAELRTERLADNLHRIAGGEAGGVVVLSGPDGLLLVDAQDSTTAGALDSAVARISMAPVRLIVTTHYHGDHLAGNARWRPRGAVTVAHQHVAAQARKDTVIAEWRGWHRRAAAAAALPMLTFADTLALHLNGEEVVVFHAPRAHTDGDAVVWFRRANVIHLGDILEIDAPPFIDWWAGGTLAGMIAAVDRVLAIADERTRIVPGHGRVIGPAELRAYRTMLVTVGDRVARGIARGQTGEQILAAAPTAEWDAALGGPRRGRQFAANVYVGLARGR